MQLRNEVNDIINRLEYLDKNTIASFSHADGGIAIIAVSPKEKKAVGMLISLGEILEWKGKAVLLAEEKHEELQKRLEEELQGGKSAIVQPDGKIVLP